MNSDFQEAFHEKYPNIDIVYDHFHIVKNFNDKVVSEVRKDLQKELISKGDEEGANELKCSRYILSASRKRLSELDELGRKGDKIRNGSVLFGIAPVVRNQTDYTQRYEELISKNKILLTVDIVKLKLDKDYSCRSLELMKQGLEDIAGICEATDNKHFLWFRKLIMNHIDGIANYAKYKVSSGKIEGINNKIKTLRRMSNGLPDDEYFFLKFIDISRARTTL